MKHELFASRNGFDSTYRLRGVEIYELILQALRADLCVLSDSTQGTLAGQH